MFENVFESVFDKRAFFTTSSVWLSWLVVNPVITLHKVRPVRTEGIAVWGHLCAKNVVTPLSQGQAAPVNGS